jgi:putative ABC transport system permease protein
VLYDALAMSTAGIAAGIPLVLWTRRFASSVVEGLHMEIAAALLVATTAMLVVALIAAYLPARRTARVDPVVALRQE